MAEQKKVNPADILAKLMRHGIEKAVEEHKNDTPTYGNPKLPAGIENGIAQLKGAKVGVYESGEHKGEAYVMLWGTVKKPLDVKGISVFGMRTQIGPFPLCPTPKASGKYKTMSDNWARIKNQLVILGAKDVTHKNLFAVCEALTKSQPHFKFRTWKGAMTQIKQINGKWTLVEVSENGTEKPKKTYPTEESAKRMNPYAGKEPLVQQEWNGYTDYKDEGELPEGMEQDDSEALPPDEATDESGEVATDSETPADDTSTEEQTGGFTDTGDMYSQADLADQGDAHAVAYLTECAEKAGISEEFLASATSWREVVDLLVQGNEDTTQEPEPEPEKPAIPEKGQVFKYTLPSANGKPGKTIDCEVVAVSEEKKVVNLKNLVDNKTIYRGVPFDKLV